MRRCRQNIKWIEKKYCQNFSIDNEITEPFFVNKRKPLADMSIWNSYGNIFFPVFCGVLYVDIYYILHRKSQILTKSCIQAYFCVIVIIHFDMPMKNHVHRGQTKQYKNKTERERGRHKNRSHGMRNYSELYMLCSPSQYINKMPRLSVLCKKNSKNKRNRVHITSTTNNRAKLVSTRIPF